MPMASQSIISRPRYHNLRNGSSTHLRQPETRHFPQVSCSQQSEQPNHLLHTTISTAISASHNLTNFTAWTFPVRAKKHHSSVLLLQPCATHSFAPHVVLNNYHTTSSFRVFPITSGGAVHFSNAPI